MIGDVAGEDTILYINVFSQYGETHGAWGLSKLFELSN